MKGIYFGHSQICAENKNMDMRLLGLIKLFNVFSNICCLQLIPEISLVIMIYTRHSRLFYRSTGLTSQCALKKTFLTIMFIDMASCLNSLARNCMSVSMKTILEDQKYASMYTKQSCFYSVLTEIFYRYPSAWKQVASWLI